MQKWVKKNNKSAKPAVLKNEDKIQRNYAAIDLGTNSCRLVIASPTPASFRIVETFSRITRLGEGIIQDNELSRQNRYSWILLPAESRSRCSLPVTDSLCGGRLCRRNT